LAEGAEIMGRHRVPPLAWDEPSSIIAAKTPRPARWLDRAFQIRLPVFVIIVAGVALVSWAGRWYLETRDPQQAMTGLQMRNLSSPDVSVRRSAADLLDGVPPQFLGQASPVLREAMKDKDPLVRRNATRSLASSVLFFFSNTSGQTPPDRDAAMLALVAALKDPDPEVRGAAARGLRTFSYKTVVANGTKGVKFVSMEIDPLIVGPPLRAMLDDANPQVAMSALRTLQVLKIPARESLSQLRRLARRAKGDARIEAIDALASAMEARAMPPDEMIAFLDDPSPTIRSAAIAMLGRHWRKDERVASLLADRLVKGDPEEKAALVGAIADVGITPDSAVPALIRALKDDRNPTSVQHRDDVARGEHAAVALTNASASLAHEALPALLTVAKQTALEGSSAAADAILAIDPKSDEARSLAEFFVAITTLNDRSYRAIAFRWLGRLAPHQPLAMNSLRDALHSSNIAVRHDAGTALKPLGPAAREALPDLEESAMMDLDAHQINSPTYAALFAVGPQSPQAGAFLLTLIERNATDLPGFAEETLRDLRRQDIDPSAALRAYRDDAGPTEAPRIAAALKTIAPPR
jgi:HEAT repeat protein